MGKDGGCQNVSTTAPVETIRNVGIIAHVDAGKTTTTERMLFYAGETGAVGNVDDGDTVTDYLAQERERGITITAAAVSFLWNVDDGGSSSTSGRSRSSSSSSSSVSALLRSRQENQEQQSSVQFNLIDTPGHVDFTYEVERSLRVMDGAVTIIDGVAGVQAQTLTVWRQALRHNVAPLIYVNKLDREGASLEKACETVRDRLGIRPLVLQMPLAPEDNLTSSSSIVDLVSMDIIEWTGRSGETVVRRPLSSVAGSENVLERAVLAREKLLEEIAECDEEFADEYLLAAEDATSSDGTGTSVAPDVLWRALQRITFTGADGTGYPLGCAVLCGASLRNVGVQPLLDTMAALLPSPGDVAPAKASPPPVACDIDSEDGVTLPTVLRRPLTNDPTCGLAFKVIHTQDSQRRQLVLVRVISGEIEKGCMVLNADTGKRERVLRVLQVTAGSIEEADCVTEGNVAALVGLAGTRTGDTLCLAKAKKDDVVRLRGMKPPPPVFTSAIEVSSTTEEDALRVALKQLCSEDPSIHIVSGGHDSNTEDGASTSATTSAIAGGDSRIVVGGMGELHLELLLDRIHREFKLPHVRMSRLRVAYRETIAVRHERDYEYEQRVGDKKLSASVRVVVEPVNDTNDESGSFDGKNDAVVDTSAVYGFDDDGVERESVDDSNGGVLLSPLYVEAFRQGLEDAMYAGPILGFPVTGVRARIVRAETGIVCNPAIARACAAMGAVAAMLDAQPALLEPVMKLELEMPEEKMGTVLTDLTAHRRAVIRSFGSPGVVESANGEGSRSTVAEGGCSALDLATIEALVPLPELLGYATQIRSLTAGEASYSLEYHAYEPTPDSVVKKLVSSGEYF